MVRSTTPRVPYPRHPPRAGTIAPGAFFRCCRSLKHVEERPLSAGSPAKVLSARPPRAGDHPRQRLQCPGGGTAHEPIASAAFRQRDGTRPTASPRALLMDSAGCKSNPSIRMPRIPNVPAGARDSRARLRRRSRRGAAGSSRDKCTQGGTGRQERSLRPTPVGLAAWNNE